MRPLSWAVVLAVVNLPIYVPLGRLFFRSWDEFRQAARFRPALGFVSLFRGESRKELLAELRLGLFTVACVAMVYAEYLGIQALARR